MVSGGEVFSVEDHVAAGDEVAAVLLRERLPGHAGPGPRFPVGVKARALAEVDFVPLSSQKTVETRS